jgi:hypothetical protein
MRTGDLNFWATPEFCDGAMDFHGLSFEGLDFFLAQCANDLWFEDRGEGFGAAGGVEAEFPRALQSALAGVAGEDAPSDADFTGQMGGGFRGGDHGRGGSLGRATRAQGSEHHKDRKDPRFHDQYFHSTPP